MMLCVMSLCGCESPSTMQLLRQHRNMPVGDPVWLSDRCLAIQRVEASNGDSALVAVAMSSPKRGGAGPWEILVSNIHAVVRADSSLRCLIEAEPERVLYWIAYGLEDGDKACLDETRLAHSNRAVVVETIPFERTREVVLVRATCVSLYPTETPDIYAYLWFQWKARDMSLDLTEDEYVRLFGMLHGLLYLELDAHVPYAW